MQGMLTYSMKFRIILWYETPRRNFGFDALYPVEIQNIS